MAFIKQLKHSKTKEKLYPITTSKAVQHQVTDAEGNKKTLQMDKVLSTLTSNGLINTDDTSEEVEEVKLDADTLGGVYDKDSIAAIVQNMSIMGEEMNAVETSIGDITKISGIGDGSISSAIVETNNIAKGAAQSIAFDTFAEMETWLKNPANKGLRKAGDNLYIKDLDVPDYWVVTALDEVDPDTGYYYTISQLETQKVDLTEYDTRMDSLESTMNNCFQSVSDGKTLVASAITDKGVDTAGNAEFATMATNIRNIKTDPILQTKSAVLSTSDQTIKADNGYDGLFSVSVPGVKGNAAVGDVVAGKEFNSATAGISQIGTLVDRRGATVDASNISSDDTYTYFTTPNGAYDTNSKIRALNSNLVNNKKTITQATTDSSGNSYLRADFQCDYVKSTMDKVPAYIGSTSDVVLTLVSDSSVKVTVSTSPTKLPQKGIYEYRIMQKGVNSGFGNCVDVIPCSANG